MNLTETNRDKNNNVTDSLANRTLIVTTILVRRKVKQRTLLGGGGVGKCRMCRAQIGGQRKTKWYERGKGQEGVVFRREKPESDMHRGQTQIIF